MLTRSSCEDFKLFWMQFHSFWCLLLVKFAQGIGTFFGIRRCSWGIKCPQIHTAELKPLLLWSKKRPYPGFSVIKSWYLQEMLAFCKKSNVKINIKFKNKVKKKKYWNAPLWYQTLSTILGFHLVTTVFGVDAVICLLKTSILRQTPTSLNSWELTEG